jgi:hypothetical protein
MTLGAETTVHGIVVLSFVIPSEAELQFCGPFLEMFFPPERKPGGERFYPGSVATKASDLPF